MKLNANCRTMPTNDNCPLRQLGNCYYGNTVEQAKIVKRCAHGLWKCAACYPNILTGGVILFHLSQKDKRAT